MSIEQTKDLLKFLKPFPGKIIETALWLREFVWKLYPDCNELIYDNYNAVAFGWSLTDRLGSVFCSIAVGRSTGNVHFGFYRGSEIVDPKNLLLGNGNQYRYILVTNKKEFPAAYMKKLLKEAHANAISGLKDKDRQLNGATITKSISGVKRKEGAALIQMKKRTPK
jgi:hypothetical protein